MSNKLLTFLHNSHLFRIMVIIITQITVVNLVAASCWVVV